MTAATRLDHCGNEVHVGDIVVPVYADASVGAQHGMVLSQASVIGLGRTRAVLRFWDRSGTYRVGMAALRVIQAGDGRDLITPNQAWERRHVNIAGDAPDA